MGNLASLDMRARGGEARLRALLEDLVQYYVGVYPQNPLALVVWFEKAPDRPEQNLLALFAGSLRNEITVTPRQSLAWKTGVEGPPYLEVHASSVEHFGQQLANDPLRLSMYRSHAEILFFDKKHLSDEITRFFNIVTAPPGLIRCWYIDTDTYNKYQRRELTLRSQMTGRPHLGIVKTYESPDFMSAKGVPHLEYSQRWLPLSLDAVKNYAWYNDWQSHPDRRTYLLVEGGSLYQILRFEVVTAPDYASKFQFLEKLPDDRYPEIYLRAVLPTENAAT
jgi:hypothetical protein